MFYNYTLLTYQLLHLVADCVNKLILSLQINAMMILIFQNFNTHASNSCNTGRGCFPKGMHRPERESVYNA